MLVNCRIASSPWIVTFVGITACLAAGCSDTGDDTTTPSGQEAGNDGAPVVDSSPPGLDTGTVAYADTGASDRARVGAASDGTVPDRGADAAVDAGVDRSVDAKTDSTTSDGAVADTSVTDAGLDSTITDANAADAAEKDVEVDAAMLIALELAVIQQYNTAATVPTPTEQQFLNKDVANGDAAGVDTGFACTHCVEFNDCLNSAVDGVTKKECEDITGNAAAGARLGTPKSQLCESVLACIFSTAPTCAAPNGVGNICYCGAANAGNACQTIAQGTGACAQQEADGLELPITDPVDILKNFGNTQLGAGVANDIIACAKGNGCSTCWQ